MGLTNELLEELGQALGRSFARTQQADERLPLFKSFVGFSHHKRNEGKLQFTQDAVVICGGRVR
jgi:hypothetical protein